MAYNYHLGYDPDKDYSLAILSAKTEQQRAALRRERENKIMDRYGGIDPYRGENEDIIRGTADASQGYLSALYARKTEAELTALQAAYEKNAAAGKASLEAIAPRYYAQRNSVWAESLQDRQDFARFGAAYGLNTGTAGQAELARTAVLQGNLADLRGRETEERAQGEAALAQLEREYHLARAAAKARGESELAQARYEESAREREDLRDRAEFEAQMAYKNADAARDTVMALLKAGAMPGADTLSAAGISLQDAQSYLGAVRAAEAAKASKKSASGKKTAAKEADGETAAPTDAITTYAGLSPGAKSLYTSLQLQMRRSGYPHMTNLQRNNVFEAYIGGTINRKEYSFIMTSLDG